MVLSLSDSLTKKFIQFSHTEKFTITDRSTHCNKEEIQETHLRKTLSLQFAQE